jgi:GcrA cell cycle regulator
MTGFPFRPEPPDPEKLERMKDAWEREGLSASQMGERFGMSKNSVVGLRYRQGWTKRASPIGGRARAPAGGEDAAEGAAPRAKHARKGPKRGAGALREAEARQASIIATRAEEMNRRRVRPELPELLEASDPYPAMLEEVVELFDDPEAVDSEVVEDPSPPAPATPFHTRDRGLCSWPIGVPKEPGFRYCDAPRARGPYCADHAAIAYVRTKGAPREEGDAIPALPRSALKAVTSW